MVTSSSYDQWSRADVCQTAAKWHLVSIPEIGLIFFGENAKQFINKQWMI